MAARVLAALLALLALGVPAGACLLCFTTYRQRLRLCHMFAGRPGPEIDKCEAAFTAAFKTLLDVEISEHCPGGGRERRGPGEGRGDAQRPGDGAPARPPSPRL